MDKIEERKLIALILAVEIGKVKESKENTLDILNRADAFLGWLRKDRFV